MYIHEKISDNRKVAVILIIILSIIPIDIGILHFFSRTSVNNSIATRELYKDDVDNIDLYVESGQYLYIINIINYDDEEKDESPDLTWHFLNYLCNDINKEKNLMGSISQSDAKEWMDYLEENYDFVYLRSIDEDFVETYGEAFEEPPDASETKVMYAVDKTVGKLVKCN
jgi:hypothetical protein